MWGNFDLASSFALGSLSKLCCSRISQTPFRGPQNSTSNNKFGSGICWVWIWKHLLYSTEQWFFLDFLGLPYLVRWLLPYGRVSTLLAFVTLPIISKKNSHNNWHYSKQITINLFSSSFSLSCPLSFSPPPLSLSLCLQSCYLSLNQKILMWYLV
jgi:hypothetical protein